VRRAGSVAGVVAGLVACGAESEPGFEYMPDMVRGPAYKAFAPNPADPSHSGAVICQRFDGATGESAFLVFDAFDVAAGPIAVLPLDQPLHLGFHAMFVGV